MEVVKIQQICTMSAESPRKSVNPAGNVVLPQPVSDRSIIESVAGFINEVVPQSYSSLPLTEAREVITWARFENADINDPALYPDSSDDRNGTPPLLLILGYGNGIQVWAIPASGEAMEVLSWRQGVVRTLRILPTPQDSDQFSHKRPLIALCDSAGPGPHFCSLSFISLRFGDQVKSIKFKNPVSDVLANRRSVVVTFPERVAVFDAATLEDRLTVTTCYPCPGPNPNPVALGPRWLAYASRRLLPARRSSGGSEGDGVQSYTAAVLHAAKSLGKGLRGLGETVASSLSAQQRGGAGAVGVLTAPSSTTVESGLQPGIVTIIDIQGAARGCDRERSNSEEGSTENMVAHFTAHSEPVVALAFDSSGMLLLTADRRGHDFHLFRIQPHPCGSSLAAVHHLYTLHRGDTTAKVQDIAFATDSRWVAVSTHRGTTHVFPITPYGGPVGTRTHATPHVVNRLSRFHRSAGLTGDATATGRNSPVPEAVASPPPPSVPYRNPRLPPYPHPTTVQPLAQVRQPSGLHPSSAPASPLPIGPQQTQHHQQHQQQGYGRNPLVRRTHSASSDDGIPLRVAACFAPPRAWLAASPTGARENPGKANKRAVDSLFVMACHGSLVEYSLEPRHASAVPKEKVCDDTPIELSVHAKAQWVLLRSTLSAELSPPLLSDNPLLALPERPAPHHSSDDETDADERWLSQVEIVTHAGPHRRLWMGPQFTFKTYNGTPGTPLSLLEAEAVDIGNGTGSRPARSNPMNMPISTGGTRPIVPVLIESGSSSSYEQSPRLMEVYGGDGVDSDGSAGPGEIQLREDLADAMMESPGVAIRDTGRRMVVGNRSSPIGKRCSIPVEKIVNPVGTVITVSVPSDEEGTTMVSYKSVRNVNNSGSEEENIMHWPTIVKPNVHEVGACINDAVVAVGNMTTDRVNCKKSKQENLSCASTEKNCLQMRVHLSDKTCLENELLMRDVVKSTNNKKSKLKQESTKQERNLIAGSQKKEKNHKRINLDSITERQMNTDSMDFNMKSKKNCVMDSHTTSKYCNEECSQTIEMLEVTDTDSPALENVKTNIVAKKENETSDARKKNSETTQNRQATEEVNDSYLAPVKQEDILVHSSKEEYFCNLKSQIQLENKSTLPSLDLRNSSFGDIHSSVSTFKTEFSSSVGPSAAKVGSRKSHTDSTKTETESQVLNLEDRNISTNKTVEVPSPKLWSKIVATPPKDKQYCQPGKSDSSGSSTKLENSDSTTGEAVSLKAEKCDFTNSSPPPQKSWSPVSNVKEINTEILTPDGITQKQLVSNNSHFEDISDHTFKKKVVTTSLSLIDTSESIDDSITIRDDYNDCVKEPSGLVPDNLEKTLFPHKIDSQVESVSESVIFNDDEVGSDTGNTSSQSIKKSRRSKKKRR
ncbi:breast carcinoma-amplified sequence 3 homolog [Schistocerca piceifrons]|uniref:breast carcinoma-amplified sequence 3 homolog n=1 Tax=Schistocerca piceifrons TaxID=274613 RepID=UPI001F5F79B3|nr:breast carcinoma-amplified sequence 3 homolog [Schistocerca piceifrons]